MKHRELDFIILSQELCRSGEFKRLRLAVGLRGREVAAALGVNQSEVSRWERGLQRPVGRRAVELGRLGAEWAEIVEAREPIHG